MSTLLSETSSSSLSVAQDKVLSILPCLTSCLSCLGSAQIIIKVVTSSSRRRTTPYRRILLGLSTSDFICSLIYPLQAFLLPRDSSDRVWAVGTDRTCTFLGFGQQAFFISIGYNCMLSCYFLLTVRFGISNEQVGKTYEPWMHAVAIGYPLITAIVGASMNMFHELELGHGCWVNDYPEGCGCTTSDENTTTSTHQQQQRDNHSTDCCFDGTVALIFGGLPTIMAFGLILTNHVLVYWHVRRTIRRSIRRFNRSTMMGTAAGPTSSTFSKLFSSVGLRRSSFLQPQQHPQQQHTSHAPLQRLNNTNPQEQRIRAVATQAFWYVAVFMITYLPSGILRILAAYGFGASKEAELFPLLVLQALFLPAQGFFNVLVYLRPTFLRTRRDYPNESFFWAVRRSLYGEGVQPTKDEARSTPSSSDFAVEVVRHPDVVVQGSTSLLHHYGLANQYPENYWSSDDDNNNKATTIVNGGSVIGDAIVEGSDEDSDRADAKEHLSKGLETPVVTATTVSEDAAEEPLQTSNDGGVTNRSAKGAASERVTETEPLGSTSMEGPLGRCDTDVVKGVTSASVNGGETTPEEGEDYETLKQ